MRRVPRTARRTALALAALLMACGHDDGATELGSDRADQVRDAAIDAGLEPEVADVLALAARGTTATFRATYNGSDGASVVVSQAPPDHRFDVVVGDRVVESRVIRDGITYRCTPPDDSEEGADLECSRSTAAVEPAGVFTEKALAEFTDSLAASRDRFDISVEDRTIAGTDVTCLTTAPKAGTPIDGTGSGADTICLSAAGAQLLTDVGGERLVADTYATEVPAGTFEV